MEEGADVGEAEAQALTQLGETKRVHIMLCDVLLDLPHGGVCAGQGVISLAAHQVDDEREEKIAQNVGVAVLSLSVFNEGGFGESPDGAT